MPGIQPRSWAEGIGVRGCAGRIRHDSVVVDTQWAAKAQKRLAVLQWVVPALTGALVVIRSYADEQQRATEVHKGIAARLIG